MNRQLTAHIVVSAAVVLVYFAAKHGAAIRAAQTSVVAALDTNARQLHAAEAHQDTTKHAAVAATVHVDSERVRTRAIDSAVTIVGPDSVQVTVADSIIRVGVPPLVVTELAQDRAQIRDDSIAINLWIANDSAQMDIITRLDERTQLLEGAVKTESHAAYWRGAKAGAVVVAIVAAVLRFAR